MANLGSFLVSEQLISNQFGFPDDTRIVHIEKVDDYTFKFVVTHKDLPSSENGIAELNPTYTKTVFDWGIL